MFSLASLMEIVLSYLIYNFMKGTKLGLTRNSLSFVCKHTTMLISQTNKHDANY